MDLHRDEVDDVFPTGRGVEYDDAELDHWVSMSKHGSWTIGVSYGSESRQYTLDPDEMDAVLDRLMDITGYHVSSPWACVRNPVLTELAIREVLDVPDQKS